jgi:hypothetical protein
MQQIQAFCCASPPTAAGADVGNSYTCATSMYKIKITLSVAIWHQDRELACSRGIITYHQSGAGRINPVALST